MAFAVWPASRKKGPSDISKCVDQDQPLNLIENSYTYPIVYVARNICIIDVTSVKTCRRWPDAASETRRLVWVYTFCICPKVPFRMTMAIIYYATAVLSCLLQYCSAALSSGFLQYCRAILSSHPYQKQYLYFSVWFSEVLLYSALQKFCDSL